MIHRFLWDVGELMGELRDADPEWAEYAKKYPDEEKDLIAAYFTDKFFEQAYDPDAGITLESIDTAVQSIPIGVAIAAVDFLLENPYHVRGDSYGNQFYQWVVSRVGEAAIEASDFISLWPSGSRSIELEIDIPKY